MKLSQKVYRDWVLGTLVYMVVLSLFRDYTDFLYISSASTIFLASLVLQALTFWTLGFKRWLAGQFTNAKGRNVQPLKLFSLWLVLFSSKFVFLWIIDGVFGENVQFSGFVGLFLAIIAMTAVKELLMYVDSKLAGM